MRLLTILVPLALLSFASVDTAGEWHTLRDGIYHDALRRSCERQGTQSLLHFCIGREPAEIDAPGTCAMFQYRKPEDVRAGDLANLLGQFDYCLQAGWVK